MKEVIFIFFIVFSFAMQSQINRRVEVVDVIKVDTAIFSKNTSETKNYSKERKHILKKMLSYCQGVDIRNAWAILNKN